MKRSKSGSTLVFCVLGLAFVAPLLAGSAAAMPPDGERPRREPDDPQRVVGVLHDQVEWWAREPQPVALAGEFSIDLETIERPGARGRLAARPDDPGPGGRDLVVGLHALPQGARRRVRELRGPRRGSPPASGRHLRLPLRGRGLRGLRRLPEGVGLRRGPRAAGAGRGRARLHPSEPDDPVELLLREPPQPHAPTPTAASRSPPAPAASRAPTPGRTPRRPTPTRRAPAGSTSSRSSTTTTSSTPPAARAARRRRSGPGTRRA